MIYLFYGENTFLLKRRLTEIKNKYLKRGFSFSYFDLERDNIDSLKQDFSKKSLFSSNVGFILKNFPVKEIDNLPDDEETIFIIEIDKEIKNIPEKLGKVIKVEKFPLLTKKSLLAWAKKEFSKNGISASEKLLEELISYTGSDLWALSQEVEKISSLKNFEGTLREEDIRASVDFFQSENIFLLIDNILSRNKKKATSLLSKYFLKEKNPYSLFFLLSKSFSDLLEIKELEEKMLSLRSIMDMIPVHSFIIRKLYFFSKKYTLSQIKLIFQEILEKEERLKKGEISSQLALSLLLLED